MTSIIERLRLLGDRAAYEPHVYHEAADAIAATLARAEKAEAELAKLADPNAVHVSMLAGTVAKPSWQQIKHIYAEEAERAEAALAEAVEALRGLRNIVEGIDGAMNHGTWRAERTNLRMKDTDEWVKAYVTLAKLEAKP